VFGSIGCNNKLLDLVKVPDSLLSLISAIIFCVLCVSFSLKGLSIIDKGFISFLGSNMNHQFCQLLTELMKSVLCVSFSLKGVSIIDIGFISFLGSNMNHQFYQ